MLKLRFSTVAILITLLAVFCVSFISFTLPTSQNSLPEAQYTIIIDAGHGGEDGGAISCTGVPESQFNLEIATRLNHLLHLFGIQTVMIRTEDISVYTEGETLFQKKVSDLKERVRIVNSTQSAMLISIHQNNFPDSQYSGAQIFYAPTSGSKPLAEQLQKTYTAALNPSSKRNTKPADGIYLMQHVTCPAILVECGFLSNVHEEAMLRNRKYQQKICSIIVTTVCNSLKDLMIT